MAAAETERRCERCRRPETPVSLETRLKHVPNDMLTTTVLR